MAAQKTTRKKGGVRRRSPFTYLLRCTHIAIKQRLLPLLLFLQQARHDMRLTASRGLTGKSSQLKIFFHFQFEAPIGDHERLAAYYIGT